MHVLNEEESTLAINISVVRIKHPAWGKESQSLRDSRRGWLLQLFEFFPYSFSVHHVCFANKLTLSNISHREQTRTNWQSRVKRANTLCPCWFQTFLSFRTHPETKRQAPKPHCPIFSNYVSLLQLYLIKHSNLLLHDTVMTPLVSFPWSSHW